MKKESSLDMKRRCLHIIVLCQLTLVFSQSTLNNYLLYKSKELQFDAGLDWQILTTFTPIRFDIKSENQKLSKNKPLNFTGRIGLSSESDAYSLYSFGHLKYKENFYAYSYPLYTNRTKKYSLNQNSIELSSAKEDFSGLGFENNWVNLQIGRGRESWGAGSDIQLALSNNGNSYDYFLLASDYGKVRVKYIHGFLENISGNINRYITARGLEWTNSNSLIIGLSETVIYSGKNRSIDIAYLNPISSHLEIELNERLNMPVGPYANGVWQIHIDCLISNRFRFSGNYLYDEFVIDSIEKDKGKEHGIAYSARVAYSPILLNDHLLTIYSSIMYIGTPTFRHSLGSNNFVQEGKPLGWFKGSDNQEVRIGLNYFNRYNIIASVSSGFSQTGKENIVNRSYEPFKDYVKESFPSGQVNETFYIDTYFSYWLKNYFSFSSGLQWYRDNQNNRGINPIFIINFFHNFSYNS